MTNPINTILTQTITQEWSVKIDDNNLGVVSCFNKPSISGFKEETWGWCIYLVCGPKSPLHSIPHSETYSLANWHGGVTYDNYITTTHNDITQDENTPSWAKPNTIRKIGADYSHYGDETYESADPRNGIPSGIQGDIQNLVASILVAIQNK